MNLWSDIDSENHKTEASNFTQKKVTRSKSKVIMLESKDYLLILIVSASMISIPATGVWLSFQPGDSCLGGVGTICFAFGFLVILFVCCVMCGCNKESPAVLSACCCTVIALFLGIILVSLYALISSTLGFALLEKHIIATESWMDIKHCLYETKNVCYQLERKYADDTPDQFTARHLTLVEVCDRTFVFM